MSFCKIPTISAMLLSAVALLTGCGPDTAYFRLNMIALNNAGVDKPDQVQQLSNTLEAMFGTPDKPVVLNETGLNEQLVLLSAGPVNGDPLARSHGLYRQHCAHCHGTTGDGEGPTAIFLNPYPRDFRKGIIKFKSTGKDIPPTHDDLARILENGVQGTAMPSFKLLPNSDRLALIEYVQYLAMRGKTETNLIGYLAENDTLPPKKEVLLGECLGPVSRAWADAKAEPVAPKPDVAHDDSVKKGRELFFTEKVACFKCHGNTQLGDGGQIFYDAWTPDAKATPEQVATFERLGGLPRRILIPRNLRQGIYRGGRAPVDIYKRIMVGIDGAQMPSNANNLSPEEAWSLVDYVLSLPFEPASENPQPKVNTDPTRTAQK